MSKAYERLLRSIGKRRAALSRKRAMRDKKRGIKRFKAYAVFRMRKTRGGKWGPKTRSYTEIYRAKTPAAVRKSLKRFFSKPFAGRGRKVVFVKVKRLK